MTTTETALDFVETCAGSASSQVVIDAFLEAIKAFGFEVASGGAWLGAGGARDYRFYFNNWPADWFKLYEANGFVAIDPMVLETRRRMTPFLWSEMANARTFTVEGARVIEAGLAYGWAEVMGFPMHGPASYQGLVTAASRKPVEVSAKDRALLRLMATAVHDRAHSSVGFGASGRPEVHLTARETECMSWVAAGKTDSEVAIILGISAATVHYHVESAKRKAGAHSRSETVALLTLAGVV